jgi:hypothetical protein
MRSHVPRSEFESPFSSLLNLTSKKDARHTYDERLIEGHGSEFDIGRFYSWIVFSHGNFPQPLLPFESQYQEGGDY